MSAILAQFWQDDDTPDELRGIEVEGWTDVLAGCDVAELRAAWVEYQKYGPRTRAGRLSRPDAGAIYKIIAEARAIAAKADKARKVIQFQPEQRVRVTAERAREIMGEVYGSDDAEVRTSLKRMDSASHGGEGA